MHGDQLIPAAPQSSQLQELPRHRSSALLGVLAPLRTDLVDLLDQEPGLGERRLETGPVEVAVDVAHVTPKQRLVLLTDKLGRYSREDHRASTRSENARHLCQGRLQRVDLLEHVLAPDEVHLPVRHG